MPSHLESGDAPEESRSEDRRELIADAEPSPIVPGQIIGERYRVGALIGAGGMGVVHEATHLGLDAPVAIKLIRTDLGHNPELAQRFLNEGRRAAALKSEHVARVHDVGQLASGALYLVMERLEGSSLDAHLRERGPLPPGDAVALALQACEGLAEAHAAGIVHRDIKPENLFLTRRSDGRYSLKILDFGISKQVSEEAPSSLTNRDRSLGSPWYMSPEQMIDTSNVDHRGDIWSLGVVLFELLTATRPFDGSTVPEVCAGVLTAPTPSLRERRHEIHPGLEAIVLRCLAKNVDDRYSDVLSLAGDLKGFVSAPTEAAVSLSTSAEDEFFERGSRAPDSAPISFAPLSSRRARRATPRAALARAIGVVGALSSLALLIWAFSRDSSKPVSEATAPPLGPRPAPAALERDVPPVVAPAAPSASPAPAGNVEAQATPPGQTNDGQPAPAEPGTKETRPTASDALLPTQAPSQKKMSPTPREPALTPEEIRRRKERYERWLREQGMQRVDEVVVPSSPEAPAGDAVPVDPR
jgi:serine/threonine-protein kinase